MENITRSDVIIIGGSYAGLSAAMALGRSLRNVLVIDSGKPCNRQTPHSHNFLTRDGETPAGIAALARGQVMKYPTVRFLNGTAEEVSGVNNDFSVKVNNELYTTRKILFATGVKDVHPPIKGFAECWGISSLHCPYCHGYEVKNEKLGVIANGEVAFEMTRLIAHWSKDLTLFTNGRHTIHDEQLKQIRARHIPIEEKEIIEIIHDRGYMNRLVFKDGTTQELKAVFTRSLTEQRCPIPEKLGCELTEHNHIKVDGLQKTTVSGVYAAGDSVTMMRAISASVATGGMAGAAINRELIEEDF